jgi:hypothetical protein
MDVATAHRLRKSWRFRTIRKRFIAVAPPTCALCGEWVDKALRYPHPQSPSLDHSPPAAALTPAQFFEWRHLQLAHLRCNQLHGAAGAVVSMNGHAAPRVDELAPLSAETEVFSNPGAETWNEAQKAAQRADPGWHGYRSVTGLRNSREW